MKEFYLCPRIQTIPDTTLNSEMSLNSAKIDLDSSAVYLNFRKRMIKFWNSDIDFFNLGQIFAEFKYYSEFKVYQF